VLFINADREYTKGRVQNVLRPQHEQKVVATYQAFEDVDGFAKVVTIDELAENDFNCNIRRYADNAPPPEPHDVRAHLHGGVPIPELDAAKPLLTEGGVNIDLLFAKRKDGYADWSHDPNTTDGRDAAHAVIEAAIEKCNDGASLDRWWTELALLDLLELPIWGTLVGLRSSLIDNFVYMFNEAGIDQFTAAGIATTWWEDSVFDLQTATSRGWKAVLEGWLTISEASEDLKNAPDLADQTAIRILAGDALEKRRDLSTEAARLDAEIKAANTVKAEYKDEDDALSPAEVKKLKADRTKAKKNLKAIDASLLQTARAVLNDMTDDDATECVACELWARIEDLINDHYANLERNITCWYDNLADKYGTTLRQLETQRDQAAARFREHLREFGYE
jgi:type I restriction enzyme M protein